jgi:glutathione peroxidase
MSILLAATVLLATMSPGGKTTIYDFAMKDIDGKTVPLGQYRGKVLLVVNVASRCGNTPQYAALEQLYTKDKDRGLVILGFPANNFGGQEPGTEAEIKEFCTLNYGVNFPMFSKISVKGDDIDPLYKWLISQVEPQKDIDWNFAKFLVGRDGKVIARFPAKMKPDAPEVTEAIEKALGAKR